MYSYNFGFDTTIPAAELGLLGSMAISLRPPSTSVWSPQGAEVVT